MSWIPLQHSPRDLTNARLCVHHAVQLVAIGVSKALLPSQADDSHTNLLWREIGSSVARFPEPPA